MRLFQYAILLHPTEQQKREGKPSEILVKPDYLLATSEKAAQLKIFKLIPDNYMNDVDLDRIEIACRPF